MLFMQGARTLFLVYELVDSEIYFSCSRLPFHISITALLFFVYRRLFQVKVTSISNDPFQI
jgi:hypothetical protein